jgi:hypothetical protein
MTTTATATGLTYTAISPTPFVLDDYVIAPSSGALACNVSFNPGGIQYGDPEIFEIAIH